MARYTVNPSCGHEYTVQLVGKNSERQRKLEWMRRGVCSDCYAAQQQAAKAAASAAAAAQAEQKGLPKLEGTEKQVAWAETIRAELVKSFSRLLVHLERVPELLSLVQGCDPADVTQIGIAADKLQECGDLAPTNWVKPEHLRSYVTVLAKTSAQWWIDNRSMNVARLPEHLAQEAAAREAALAEELRREGIEQYRESVRRRVLKLVPTIEVGWSIKVGEWSGCKRVYFGHGYGSNFAILHVTGDRYNAPNSMACSEVSTETREALHALLKEVASKYTRIEIYDSRN